MLRRLARGLMLSVCVLLAGWGMIPGLPAAVQSLTRRGPRAPAAQAVVEPTLQQLLAAFDVERAMGHIRHLADDIGPRPCGSPQERRAARYIATELRKWDWRVQVQDGIPLFGTSLRTPNVIGDHPRPSAGPVLLAGAHMDSAVQREASPGANDNASGVAVLLEVARILRHNRLPCRLRLVFFGGEEYTREQPEVHHVGSEHYVAGLSEPARAAILAMISVDMVGAGPRLVASRLGYGTDRARQALLASADRLGLEVQAETGPPWSDHEAFELAGIPTVWLTRMGGDRNWHTPRDTAARIGPQALTQSGRLVIHFLVTAARPAVESS